MGQDNSSEQARAKAARYARMGAAVSLDVQTPSPLRDKLERFARRPDQRVRVKAMARRAEALANAFSVNGTSSYTEVYLRQFLREYNSRVFKTHGSKQPLSFNIMREFVEPDEDALVLRLHSEKLSFFSLPQFLDEATAPGSPSIASRLRSLKEIDEHVIYEYNQLGTPARVDLPDLADALFAGLSCIREGGWLSVIAIYGDRVRLEMLNPQRGPQEVSPGKEFLLQDQEGEPDFSPESFFNVEGYYPVIVMFDVEISSGTRSKLYVMEELSDAFMTTFDDAENAEYIKSNFPKSFDTQMAHNAERLKRFAPLIELSYQLLSVPGYFKDNPDDITIERRPTGLRTDEVPITVRTKIEQLEGRLRPQYVNADVFVRKVMDATYDSILKSSGLKIETGGYWKVLPGDAVGADKNSAPVHGRSWVRKDLSWYEVPLPGPEFSVPINVADIPSGQAAEGYVNIMRSPAHARDVFKVGFTTNDPESRADQLSATTGQPDHFLVVGSWKVSQPRYVEASVHSELKKYRLSGSREFFRCKYSIIHESVERNAAPFVLG